MTVAELEQVYDGTIWLCVKPHAIKSSCTTKYDKCEIETLEINEDDNSLDVWLKEKNNENYWHLPKWNK